VCEDHTFLFHLAAARDIIHGKLVLVSKLMQRADVMRRELKEVATAARISLKNDWGDDTKKEDGGPSTRALHSMINKAGGIPKVPGESMTYCYNLGPGGVPLPATTSPLYDYKVTVTGEQHQEAEDVVREFVSELRQNLKHLFSSDPDSVPLALSVLIDSKRIASAITEGKLASYGDHAVQVLMRWYGVQKTVDHGEERGKLKHKPFITSEFVEQWDRLKNRIVEMQWLKVEKVTDQDLSSKVLSDDFCRNHCKEVCLLIEVYLVQVVTTVKCETEFSDRTTIKTPRRPCLGDTMLDVAMTIVALAPEPEDKVAVEKMSVGVMRRWQKAKKRCPGRGSSDSRSSGHEPLSDALPTLAGLNAARSNDGIDSMSSSDNEEEEVNGDGGESALTRVRVDAEQEQADAEKAYKAAMERVGAYQVDKLYVIATPDLKSLDSLATRWKLLKNKKIVYNFPDGWRMGTVTKKGQGPAYGGKLWVSYGKRESMTGHVFDPELYGDTKEWACVHHSKSR